MERVIEPEILDHIDPQSSEARRSRFDLRVVNYVMGGESWIMRELEQCSGIKRVVELGAGEGSFLNKIAARFPDLEVIGMDLLARPEGLEPRVLWESGDVLSREFDFGSETVVVANMFLHHFDSEQLECIDRAFSGVGMWLCHEPYRSRGTLGFASLLWPFMGKVTKHDMMVSIRAGFQIGELGWSIAQNADWQEKRSWEGGLRSKVVRR